MVNLPTVGKSSPLNIGEVAALTGISAGRIRHYESRGLLLPGHSLSGYRLFGAPEILRLLQIDLLRSLGMGLDEIRHSLSPDPLDVRAALERHRQALEQERLRLDRLLEAVGEALAAPHETTEAIVGRLAHAHRENLGVFGRLARPLSEDALKTYRRLLGQGWDLPVPELFGHMLLPEPITDLLEKLAKAEGNDEFFERLRRLAGRVLELTNDPQATPAGARRLGAAWVKEQLTDPPPEDVSQVLRREIPRLAELPVMRDGFRIWAEAISPLAAQALSEMEAEADRRGILAVGALVATPEVPRSDGSERKKKSGKDKTVEMGRRRVPRPH